MGICLLGWYLFMNSKHIAAGGKDPPFPLTLFLSHSPYSSLTFALQKRLPSDRVSGTLSLSVENDHLEPRPEDIESEAF